MASFDRVGSGEAILRSELYRMLRQGFALLVDDAGLVSLVHDDPARLAVDWRDTADCAGSAVPRSVFDWLLEAQLIRRLDEMRFGRRLGWRERGLPGDRGQIWVVRL